MIWDNGSKEISSDLFGYAPGRFFNRFFGLRLISPDAHAHFEYIVANAAKNFLAAHMVLSFHDAHHRFVSYGAKGRHTRVAPIF